MKLSDYEDDKYNLFKSLFLKKLNPKEIKEEIIQGVVEELENRNILEQEYIISGKKYKSYDGIPISVLQNLSPEEKIEIEIEKPWNFLGMYNQKNLKIKGKVGRCLGIDMPKGEIIVDGDAESVGEWMKGGKIIVNGNVDYAGDHMRGGEIWINGDAGEIGSFMEGGRIVVNGYAKERIGDCMSGGEIWVKELELKNLSPYYEIGMGKIYKGLPGEDFEPVRIFEILEKSENEWIFLYFDKRKGEDSMNRILEFVLTKISRVYKDFRT